MKIRLRQAAPIAALLSLMASGSQAAVQLPGPDALGLVAKAQGVSGLATAVSEGVQTNIASTADVGGPQMPGVRVVENVASVPEPAAWACSCAAAEQARAPLRRPWRSRPSAC
jgi:hypothetical protein